MSVASEVPKEKLAAAGLLGDDVVGIIIVLVGLNLYLFMPRDLRLHLLLPGLYILLPRLGHTAGPRAPTESQSGIRALSMSPPAPARCLDVSPERPLRRMEPAALFNFGPKARCAQGASYSVTDG